MYRSSLKSLLAIAFVLSVLLSLGACSGADNKIGTTVKGTRVAILDNTKTLKADADLQENKPSLSRSIDNSQWLESGYDTAHVIPNADIALHPQILWSADIGEGSSSDFKLLTRPIVAGDFVFTMDSQGLISAFDTKTGKLKWQFDTTPLDRDGKAIAGGLASNGTTLYATTGFGEVLALAANNGAVKWRNLLLNPLRAAPTVLDGRVFVVSIDNELQVLDARRGNILWHHNGIAESATLMGASSPAIVGDSVVVAYSSGEIFNLRAENGRASWNYSLTTPTQVGALPAIADIRGLPVIDRGQVYVISHSGRMASIDERTGERAWENEIGGITTPLLTSDTIFVLSTDDQLIAVERNSGRVIWVKDMQHLLDPADTESDHIYWSGPILGHDLLWMTNSLGQLVSFSPDNGATIETIDLGDPSYIPPIIAKGIMYVITDNGKLIALH